jgi:hypothetical protein
MTPQPGRPAVIRRALLCASLFGCGGQVTSPGEPREVTLNAGGTIAFTPASVVVARYPAVCGVMNPPFTDGDRYSMDIIGSEVQAPYDELFIRFPSPVMVGTPLTLAVQAFSTMGTESAGGSWYAAQTAEESDITFSYVQGSDPTEIDTGAFDSVTITILAMPMKDGDPLTIQLRIHFVDGLVLDETYSGPLASEWSGCSAG